MIYLSFFKSILGSVTERVIEVHREQDILKKAGLLLSPNNLGGTLLCCYAAELSVYLSSPLFSEAGIARASENDGPCHILGPFISGILLN